MFFVPLDNSRSFNKKALSRASHSQCRISTKNQRGCCQKKYRDAWRRSKSGFTLIEGLVILFVFSVITLTFYQTFSLGTQQIIESKSHLGATALANQKMEVIRSIDYDVIGTTNGIPAGDLLESETVTVNTVPYTIHTFVQYADDAFDGRQGDSPADAIPTDYKRVRLTASWGAGGDNQSVVLFGNFSPNGVETSGGGGTLSINVLDASGSGVAGVTVHIVNGAAGVDVSATTDATGNITLPGAPVGTESYELTVSKSGYYGTKTYPSYPTSTYNPVDVHASVVADTLSQKTIVMDQYADITVRSRDPFGITVPDISFAMTGGKILGTDPVTSSSVYEYNQNLSTNGSGIEDIADQSYGQYTLSASDARYKLYKLSPESAASDVFDALPGQVTTVDMILVDTQIGSVKVTVVNDEDDSPVAGATVHLTNASLGYDATGTTDQYGMAYFPTALPELADGTYDMEVSATGFDNENTTVTINSALETKMIRLNP